MPFGLEDLIAKARGAIPGAGRGALKTLTATELFDAATVACVSGKYNLLGTHVITPQTTMKAGFGRTGVTNEQIGMLYIKNKDDQATPVEVPGTYRIAILDAEDRVRGLVVHSVRYDSLNIDKTNLSTGFKFPVQGIEARAYDKIAVFLKPDATANVVQADSDIKMDCTLYG